MNGLGADTAPVAKSGLGFMEKALDKAFFGYNAFMVMAGGAILLTIAIATFVFSQDVERQSLETFRLGSGEQAAEGLLTTVLDAETGQRGYLLTHDARYLGNYRSARDRSLHFRGELHATAETSAPDAAPLVKQADVLVDEKLSEMDKTIARADAGDFAGAIEIVKSDFGRSLMNEIRETVGQLRERIGDLRDQRIRAVNSSAAALRRLTTLGAIAILVLTVLALRSSAYHTRELDRARAELTAANEQLEARVQERTRDLKRANDETHRYAYIISHDLRAPLINITGFTGEIVEAIATVRKFIDATEGETAAYPQKAEVLAAVEEDLPEAVRFINISLARMDNLISQILKLSRLGRVALTPEAIKTDEVALECLAMIQRRLDESGGEALIAGTLPGLVTDRNALQQIFTNLLDNAVKFFDKSRPGRIVICGRLERRRALFEIEDNGRGVKPTDIERIFEPFRRSGTQDTIGDGIGLAHVRALVRRLGGDIDASSDGASGSVFRFSVARDLRTHLKDQHAQEEVNQ
jgi:signal transduction histidine kinase